jgi:hypothetical protein
VDDNRLGEVLHCGGQSGNYQTSDLFKIVTMATKVKFANLLVSFP